MISRSVRRFPLAIAVLSLAVSACAGSEAASDDGDPTDEASARQDITEADQPDAAAVATTSTSTTSTTTTTTTSTTTTTTTEPPAPATTAAPEVSNGAPSSGAEVGFAAGEILAVGSQVNPGLYIARPSQRFCTWNRVVASGDDEGSISQGQVIVEILSNDATFGSDADCGEWEPYVAPSSPATVIGEGHWVVGEQIEPGTYRTDQTTFDFCYWERSRAFTHSNGEIIINAIVTEQETVTIQASDVRFVSSGCGNWTRVE